jgi:preflagellin peptidase FlaK
MELFNLKIIVGLIVLVYSSYLDLKYRKIDDKAWISLILLGVSFFIFEYMQQVMAIKDFVISITITAILSLALYYLGILGGGDVKILIGISALIPRQFQFSIFPYFSLTVFANAVVISSLLPLLFFAYNIREIKRVRNVKDFLVLFLGYKKDGSKVGKHETIIAKNGKYNFLLRGKNIKLGEKAEGEVWVSPAIPFIIPITIGFVIASVGGDILSHLMS